MPRWQKGQSGNPKGKPAGISKIAEFRRLIEAQAPALVETCLRLALSGDPVALRLCIERLIPALKNVDPAIVLPRADDGNVKTQSDYILAAMLSGGIAPNLALAALQGLQIHFSLTQLQDLEARIAKLEGIDPNDSDPHTDE